MNKYYEIMTQNLTECFVDHRNIGLAPQAVTEFAFHHAECGFDVRPFVIVLQKLGAPELKVVVHLRPRSATSSNMIGFERNIRSRPNVCNRIGIRSRGVTLVGGYFGGSYVYNSQKFGNFHSCRGEMRYREFQRTTGKMSEIY